MLPFGTYGVSFDLRTRRMRDPLPNGWEMRNNYSELLAVLVLMITQLTLFSQRLQTHLHLFRIPPLRTCPTFGIPASFPWDHGPWGLGRHVGPKGDRSNRCHTLRDRGTSNVPYRCPDHGRD